jgi:UDP-N-acetylglucosamine 2-epimerase
MGRIKVLSVFGTRPDTIKLAPVVAELSRHPEKICSVTVGTAQHRDMMDQVLAVFGISPDYDLGVMQDDQSLFDIAERGLRGLEAVLLREKPDITLVHGDSSTPASCSISYASLSGYSPAKTTLATFALISIFEQTTHGWKVQYTVASDIATPCTAA